jgi:hypothetical protein
MGPYSDIRVHRDIGLYPDTGVYPDSGIYPSPHVHVWSLLQAMEIDNAEEGGQESEMKLYSETLTLLVETMEKSFVCSPFVDLLREGKDAKVSVCKLCSHWLDATQPTSAVEAINALPEALKEITQWISGTCKGILGLAFDSQAMSGMTKL